MRRPPVVFLAAALFTASMAPRAHSQWREATGQTVTALMDVPKDGVEYYAARQRAIGLMSQRDFAGAESVFVRLAREYPRDGMNWIRLAQAQASQRKFAEAAHSTEMSGPLYGWGPPYNSGINVGRWRYLAGDTAAALSLFAHAVFTRHDFQRQQLFDDPAFAGLRDNLEFRHISGRADARTWSRNEGWTHDVDYVYEEIKRTSPDFREGTLPAEFTRRYEALKRDVTRLSDEELYVGLKRMLAVLHAGHTGLFVATGSRFVPIRPYLFPEGLYIIEARDSSLIGARIVSVGRMTTDSLLRAFGTTQGGDGDNETLWHVSELAVTHMLKGIGAISRVDSVPLVIEDRAGRRRSVTIATDASAPSQRQDKLVAPFGAQAPLFLGTLGQAHWEKVLPAKNAVYLQINNITDDPNETLTAFGLRIGALLDTLRPKNVIIDLRHNNGGNTNLYREMLRSLIAYSRQPGSQAYVLIGRRTFSAAANFITDLERFVRPVWVGEASSECCNLNGDPTPLRLPYSGIGGEFSVVRWNLSANPFDGRREISPDVPVQLTAKAYFAGEDPALEAVYRLMQQR